jgi:hypothetical protein
MTPRLDNLIDLVDQIGIKVDGWSNRLDVIEET